MTGTKSPVTGMVPELAPDLRAVLERHADRLDLELVDRALRFSASAHRGQKRMSGEDFVSHTIAVAMIPFLIAATAFSYFALANRKWQQGGRDD